MADLVKTGLDPVECLETLEGGLCVGRQRFDRYKILVTIFFVDLHVKVLAIPVSVIYYRQTFKAPNKNNSGLPKRNLSNQNFQLKLMKL